MVRINWGCGEGQIVTFAAMTCCGAPGLDVALWRPFPAKKVTPRGLFGNVPKLDAAGLHDHFQLIRDEGNGCREFKLDRSSEACVS